MDDDRESVKKLQAGKTFLKKGSASKKREVSYYLMSIIMIFSNKICRFHIIKPTNITNFLKFIF